MEDRTTVSDLTARSRYHQRRCRETLLTTASAEEAIRATLTDEQTELFDAYEHAFAAHWSATIDLYVAELQRHAPGLEPAIGVLMAHVQDGHPLGACCNPPLDRS